MPYGMNPKNHGNDMSDVQGCAAWILGMMAIGVALSILLYAFVWS